MSPVRDVIKDFSSVGSLLVYIPFDSFSYVPINNEPFWKKFEVALFLSNCNYFYHRWAPLIILDLFIANPLTFLASSLTNNPFNFFTLASPLLGNLSFYHKNCRDVNTLTSLTTSANTSLLIFAYSSDMSGARQDKDLFFLLNVPRLPE